MMEPRAFMAREDRLRNAAREYFERYNDANNAQEMMSRLMRLSHGALDPKWVAEFCEFLFEKGEAE